ncbi:zinc metalloproteinase-disintegrin-like MTP8 [Diadema antillarum]|uniref:zinc metalloproteinase-disintegrin-like MTP8 n=1 Tax=Diadema antillarum TaxID=105358 RepID=UPI003A8A4219
MEATSIRKPNKNLHFVLYYLLVVSFSGIILLTEQCSGYRVPSGREEQLGRLTNYDIITPHRLEGRERRQAQTLTEDGHIRETSIIVPVSGQELIIDLELNENLFPARFVTRSYAQDGGPITRKPHPHHHCYYHGKVRGSIKSSVAVSTCNGISGVVNVDGETYFIEPLKESDEEHLVYRLQDRKDKKTVAFDLDTSHDEEEKEESSDGHHRQRRDIHTETKFIELVIVNDYQEFLRHEENVEIVEDRSKEMANMMDMIYRPMNVRVALVGVVTWSQGDAFQVNANPSTTMAEFQRWRKDVLLPDIKNDNAQFITGVNFDGSTVGMASLGTMCSDERSGGVSQDHDSNVAVVASTLAHEMGHNLGFIHDTSDRNCICDAPSNVGCVMEPSSGPIPPTNFSTCSYDDLNASLEKGLGACLFDYPDMIFDGPICGNGFLENGEECDCGSPEECKNDCCIASTCRLHENATCANGECCEDCQLKKAGEVCRDIGTQCDLPEYCTGLSAKCPANVYRQNGEPCKDTVDATCYDGQCLTLDHQCESVWGGDAKAAHEKCFTFNTQGSSFGNCGGSRTAFEPCLPQHVKCGKLMCQGGSSYPVLSSLAKASQGYIWDENNVQHTCKSASIDLGQDVPDPGYVATGSLCAPGFVCSNFQCRNLSTLNIRACPFNCHNNGVCNSKNHCHCDPQWNPPLCNTPGYGGSIDSGPARPTDQPVTLYPKSTSLIDNPQVTRRIIVRGGPGSNTVIVLLVMFLCVLPGLTLLGIVLYCKRDTLSKMVSKGAPRQKYSQSRYGGKDTKASSATPSSSSVPSRPAPVKPTIQHTHLQEMKATSNPSRPSRPSAVPPVTIRPAPRPPASSNRQPATAERPPFQAPGASSAPKPKVPPAPRPVRPSPVPPVPSTKPPSPAKSPPAPAVPAFPKPSAIHSSNKPQFRLPPPIDSGDNKVSGGATPPHPPTKPALRPPSSSNKAPGMPSIPTRPKPNVNRNNSKAQDEESKVMELKSKLTRGESAPGTDTVGEAPSKPSVPKKPVPPKRPAVPNKPRMPSWPPAPVKQDPVV